MTIKRGRWAARVPGLRWGGQQIPREPRIFFGVDFGEPFSAVAVLLRGVAGDLKVLDTFRLPTDVQQAESRLHRLHHLPPVEFKLYPYQEDFVRDLLKSKENRRKSDSD